ncbi:serine hydroxymethyltransferase [bacterium]|jgi:glycine hydroxymethyltransferase|nr:serine hydroxymethyltransferase [bacterium]
MKNLNLVDPEISNVIEKESNRQKTTINLIASENYTSKAIMEAAGSVLTNKYAEGYPSKRYYAGCEFVDQTEAIAIERCKKLFNADHANVQPHAGSQANFAVYIATLKPGDAILGMNLASGGHLTHGHAVNLSGMLYKSVQYGLNKKTELLDYQEISDLAHQHKPKLIIAGASAYSRFIDFEKFAQISKDVGALLLVDMAHIAGLIAAGVHPTPVPFADFVTSTTHKTLRGPRGGFILCKNQHSQILDKAIIPGSQGGPFMNVIAAKAVAFKEAKTQEFIEYQKQVVKNAKALTIAMEKHGYRIVSGGTDNHLFIVDLRSKNITGRDAEKTLELAGITVSRSCIPFDPEKPWITSGVRLGTPAITTRGFKENDMNKIAQLVDTAIKNPQNIKILENIRKKVEELLKR